MILSAVVTLLSSQLQVYVASGVTADQLRASELCTKTQCLDGTAVHERFFTGSTMGAWDFDTFNAGPMEGWPKSLDDTWRAATAKCRAIAGPPPWKGNVATVSSCADRTARELWGAWLAHHKATQVAVFSKSRNDKGDVLRVRSYTFPANEARIAEVPLAMSTLDEALKQLAPKAAKVAGLPDQFELPPKEEAKSFVGSFAGEAAVTSAVSGVKTCDLAPSLIEVVGSDPLAKSIATRWAASKVGTAQGRKCTLSETTREERGLMKLTVVTATLVCGDVAVASELATMAKNPVDTLSGNLVKMLSQRLCR